MTEMPLSCDPHKLPSTDDLIPAIVGALDAAKFIKRYYVRLVLVKPGGVWTLRHGGVDDLNNYAVQLTCRSTGTPVAEAARDLIDRYRPHHTEGQQ